MASTPRYLTPFSRGVLSSSLRPQVIAPSFICPLQQQQRYASKSSKSKDSKPKKKKPMYTQYDIRHAIQFSLCDAMRCVYRAIALIVHLCGHSAFPSQVSIRAYLKNFFSRQDIFAHLKRAVILPPSSMKSMSSYAQNETSP